jgi:hypothetical protein
MTYNVIGPDGSVYGPVDEEGLKSWVAQSRVLRSTTLEEVGSGRRFDAGSLTWLFPPIAPTQTFEQPAAPTGQTTYNYSNPPQPTAGYNRAGTGEPINNNLVKAIIVTLCCCLPGGIVSIVYASQVAPKQAAGDYQGALDSADKANKWANYSMIASLVFSLIYYGLIAVGVLANQGLHR